MSTVLTNARIVTADAIVAGTLVLDAGRIQDLQLGISTAPATIDLDGDYLLPGAVDLHTDNLERHARPRPNVLWPSRQALLFHDSHCAGAGVTTVLNALSCGGTGLKVQRTEVFRKAVSDLRGLDQTGLLKADHYLHLRCDLLGPDTLDLLQEAVDDPRVRMVSMTDHGPGVGQYADPESFRARHRREGLSEDSITQRMDELVEQRARMRGPNMAGVLARVEGRPIVVASHDDRTEAEVTLNHQAGVRVSEFPVTIEAARLARTLGMRTIGGAPNLVRGGSHSGNVAVSELLHAGLIDALASDYVPGSLIDAAFRCTTEMGLTLPEAVSLIADHPAQLAGLDDRGRIEPGLRADLVRVRVHDTVPVVRSVWREGERVA